MQPLQGVRIIEVTTNASGPLATGLLADQGADVIRLETIEVGDPSRHVGGVRGGVSGYNGYMNRNKRSIAVDLKDEGVRPFIYDLIKTADVFVQNSRPGALERSGYGFDELHRINPELIYLSISGFGPDGPAAGLRVYDPIIQGASGFASAQGVDGPPELVKTIASDKIAAYTAAQAISAGLFARERGTVSGHKIDISMLDANLAFLWADVYWNHSFVGDEGFEPKPLISEFYRVVKTADSYITTIIVGDVEFKAACEVLDMPELLEDARFNTLMERFTNYGLMLSEIEKKAVSITSADLVARMEAAGVPCGAINTFDEVLDDPRVAHSGSIIEFDHPRGGRMRQARPPAVFNDEPAGVRLPSPALGEHTDELLGSVGCSAQELASLRKAGAIA
ncbi:MAG: CoA transferase [Gammaproteobacteria bacterium]|nr:CoA transferase [Gammaproteobacteria bacterium]MBQ0840643.1 CoA transferase [Gammaproteobacteria bacterium]